MENMEREIWNMKGNTQKFLSAEKDYKNAYRTLIGPMPKNQNEEGNRNYPVDLYYRWVSALSQPIEKKDEYESFISKAKVLMERIKVIIPPETKLTFVTSTLNTLGKTQPKQNVLSCICYHTALTNLCEFVHLHREADKFKTGYMLTAKADKQLGLGVAHYAGIAKNLIDLTTSDITERMVEEAVKLIGKNIYRPIPVVHYRRCLEEALPFAELAYNDHVKGQKLTPIGLKLSNGFDINGRFYLPLSFSGYIANANCTDRTIVGFRGTSNVMNWITDFTQYLVGSSLVYKMALGLLIEIHAQKGDRMLVVGHSLGGGLTQYSVAGLNVEDVVGFCYNSAGLSNMAYSELGNCYQHNIWHLHLNYDQIYLIGNQLGYYSVMRGLEANPIKAHFLSTMRRHSSVGRLPHYRIN